jgi:hypothetical protein
VEFRQRLDLLLAEHLAAVGTVAVVPLQFGAHPVVHADVEVRQHEHRRLQPLGEVEGLHGQVEALLGIRGEDQHVLGVAVRGVGAEQDVALLRAGRHAGRGTDALDVEDHGRDLGVVGEPDELAHQRDARAAGRGERTRAVPGGAEHHADRRQLVLRLDHGVVVPAGLGVDAQLRAEALEGVHQRGGRRDRITTGPRSRRRRRRRGPPRCCHRS